ncbi:MAG: glycosyltransferase family 4 protein [Enterococcus sp.]|nr:glycosyltransferase family 4 protein [Enterococcus sp.]
MSSLALQLVKLNDIKLGVATTYNGAELQEYAKDNIIYYLIPRKKINTKYDSSLEFYWDEIVRNFLPDIIHIHGTEFAHGLACMKVCKSQKYVISIQGLVSEISKYNYAGINLFEFLKYTTLNDLIKMSTVIQDKKKMEIRGKYEIEYLKHARHIIGRTSWDYAHVKTLQPKVNYHFCNEMLRDSFYSSNRWNIDDKQNYLIFMSQAKSQHKGLHILLKAMVIIKNYYPDVRLRIAGLDITGGNKWVHRTRTYGHFIRSLLRSLQLQDSVEFLGNLNEERMAEEYRRAHVFVSPSIMENSPNSLGEAQIIGTPCVVSFVGGTPDMVNDRESGLLYRYEEYRMLAFKVIEIFQNDPLAQSLSDKSKIAASIRHNREQITTRMKNIYIKILK